jgi:hypothetical protein
LEPDHATVVIPLTDRDLAFIHSLEQFYREVQARLGDMMLILVDERGCPVMPSMNAASVPDDAIQLPTLST